MNTSRYNRPKRKRQRRFQRKAVTKHLRFSDERRHEVSAAVNSVDEVARNLEQKWGIGKLKDLPLRN